MTACCPSELCQGLAKDRNLVPECRRQGHMTGRGSLDSGQGGGRLALVAKGQRDRKGGQRLTSKEPRRGKWRPRGVCIFIRTSLVAALCLR